MTTPTTLSLNIQSWQQFLYGGPSGFGGLRATIIVRDGDGNAASINFFPSGTELPKNAIIEKSEVPYGVVTLSSTRLADTVALLRSQVPAQLWIDLSKDEASLTVTESMA